MRDPVYEGATAALAAGDDPEAPEYPMPEASFRHVARTLVEQARSYAQNHIQPACERAWRYYHMEVDQDPMGRVEVDGQPRFQGSAVVESRVRDTVNQVLPELFRIFVGSAEIVEFEPRGPEDVEGARQATDVLTAWFWQQDGARFVHDALLDWSIKFAAARVWAEEHHEIVESRFAGLTEEDLAELQQDPGFVELVATPYVEHLAVPAPLVPGQPPQPAQVLPVTLHEGTLKRRCPYHKRRFALIPQEELLFDGDAPSLDRCRIVGTDSYRTVSELVALGLDHETVKRHAVAGDRSLHQLRSSREGGVGYATSLSSEDMSTHWVRVTDAHLRIDRDQDGIAEVYHVIALGEEAEVALDEPDEWPDYVVSSPFLISHKIVGEGIAETMLDRQDIATALVRRGLDSLNRSLIPRVMCEVRDEAEAQALDDWYASFVPLDPSRVGHFAVPFVGQHAFDALQRFTQGDVLRTGISQAGQGLDPSVLTNKTVDAAKAIISAPQSRVEYFARIFAETFMAPLFRAMLKLTVRYPNQGEVIRLRNRFVPVDPRHWRADYDCSVKVGLGTGTREERLFGLQAITAKQEALLAAGSPLVDLAKYHASLADLCALVGVKDPARYFVEPTPELQAQAQAQAKAAQEEQAQKAAQLQALVEQAKQGAAAQAKIEVERIKAALEERLAAQENAFKQEQEMLRHRLKQQELAMERQLELYKIRSGSPDGQGNIPAVVS